MLSRRSSPRRRRTPRKRSRPPTRPRCAASTRSRRRVGPSCASSWAERRMAGGLGARRASAEDLPALTETMALAFYEDPVWGWAFPDPDLRLDQHRDVWGELLDAGLQRGSVWMVGDDAAAALWVPPGQPELTPEHDARVQALVAQMPEPTATRARDTMDRFDANHPEAEPHHYLSLLATHPDHRGKGIGMALLAE